MRDEDWVLVVEDDEDLRTAIADVLRDEGMKVAEAGDGVDALAWLHTHERPRVILLDLMMPRMDGIQFRTAQLAEPELASVPVVIMTASTAHQDLLDAAHVDEVIHKPVTAEKLRSVAGRHN